MTENQRLYRIISQVFGIPVEQITEETGADNIKDWDSVSLMNLTLALEAEYGVELQPDDMADMLSVKLVRLILQERGITTNE